MANPPLAHPWRLVGPWYRWPQPGVAASGRGTAPAIQKFASDDFLSEFLATPQHSLRYEPALDQVHVVDYTPAPAPTAAALAGKISSLFPLNAQGAAVPSRTRLNRLPTRKVYLASHGRHYVVVCELHCDMAGFPSPSSREVCQAGFVVRRRHLSYPSEAKTAAKAILKDLVAVDAAIAAKPPATAHDKPRQLSARVRALFGGAQPDAAALRLKRAALYHQLQGWKVSNGAEWVTEGWLTGDKPGFGAWQPVEDEPQDLQETWFPLWPLFADPAKPQHDARFGTLFFGVLPTASADTDNNGRARFDPQSAYELRCFLRRHDTHCPRGDAPDCHGELVWSAPSERYQIAPPFDLLGCSNRPVTIQMPNLAELAAQAATQPLGTFSPVKVVQPQTLAPKVKGMASNGGSMSGNSICFISIPLITIVALFVFNLFLPIVVFIFGLWFLLAFKFCIPPQISFDAGLEAQLEAAPPSLDAEFDVSVGFSAGDLNNALVAGVGANIETGYGLEPGQASGALKPFSNVPLAELAGVMRSIDGLPDDIAADPPVRGDLSAGLVYEPPVVHPLARKAA
jgi:hypothetical protein